MTWSPILHAVVLIGSAGLATWAGMVARGRRTMPGSGVFGAAMFAIAYWALISALHAIVDSNSLRIRLAQFQYVGIVAVAPLWLMFGSEYARARWLRDRASLVLLWVVPLITLVMAFTNDWHHWLWVRVEPITVPGGVRLVYHHGPWFWIAVAYNYLCLTAGTVLLLHSLRRFPLPYRRQTLLFLGGALLPWLGNALYISGALPPGLDFTPVGFAASGGTLLWGVYRHRLFGLVPIARDLVVDSMDEAVIVLDAERNLVDFNLAAERVAGCSADGIGRPVDQAVHWWMRAVSHGSPPVFPAVIAADGRFLEVDIKPVRDGHERFAGWLVIARDMSARRKADLERRALDARVQEQQRLESLSVLAGGMAHDFNNLLTSILGNADLISMEASDPAVRKSADSIVIGAQRAAELVSKMLAYAGEGRGIAELVDLDELVREMHNLLQASVARHCRLEYRSSGTLPHVKVDPTQVRQVVMNLIVNAAEAVDDGGLVTVSGGIEALDAAALEDMTFSAEAVPGRFAFVQVADNGPGMDHATQARIFEPFFSTKQTGRGLGLAAVQGIIRSHHGALKLTSTRSRGTTFKVWFPVADVSAVRRQA
jgi:signal transduction histidine kinase